MKWKIQVKNYRCFTDEHPLTIDLSNPVTALIGPNNSGKSAALRFFWELAPMVAHAPSALMHAIGQRGEAQISNDIRPLSDVYAVFSELNDRPIIVDLLQLEKPRALSGVQHMVTEAARPIHLRVTIDRQNLTGRVAFIHNGVAIDEFPQGIDVFNAQEGALIDLYGSQHQYVWDNQNNLYGFQQRTYIPAVRPYGKISVDDAFELTLGRSIVTAWDSHKGAAHAPSRRFAASIEQELARIFGFNQLEIYATADKHDLILRIDNNRSFPLQDMGTGIGQFLTLLLNATPRGNPLVLFDEPEIGMHASLQVELMSMIAKYAQGPIIFATHSIGLARSVADEILSFSMVDGHSQPRPFEKSPSYLETLGELSFSAWREIGCDGVLFVEGPNDVKVISEWLRKMGLGRKWALLPLGGSETIHADGVQAIRQVLEVHPNVAVIIDSEKDSADAVLEKKRAAFQNACGEVGIPCLVTALRATENYFPVRAIKEACGENASALGPYEKLSLHGWGKRDGLKIASKMSDDEIEATDIAQFLREQSE
jgi:hypothetical protein